MPRKKTTILVSALVLVLVLARPTAYAAGSIIHFERPGLEAGGALVESIAARAGQITVLARITSQDLDRLEAANLSCASRELLALLGLASSPASAQTRGIAAGALPGASAVFKEGFNDLMSFVRGDAEKEQSSDLNYAEARKFIEKSIREMLNTDTTNFISEEVRREFWKKTGIYEKYNDSQIAYLNRAVVPSVAAFLVMSNEMGLYDFWQSLNGLGAEVASGEATRRAILDASGTEPFEYGSLEEADLWKLMELHNGSVGALGLIYHAAKQQGSGTGKYGSADGRLLDFELATAIPLSKVETRTASSTWTASNAGSGGVPLGQPSENTGSAQDMHNTESDSSAFEFTISHRITK